MKKSRFTEAQIMGVLRQAEGGLAVPELCRAHTGVIRSRIPITSGQPFRFDPVADSGVPDRSETLP